MSYFVKSWWMVCWIGGCLSISGTAMAVKLETWIDGEHRWIESAQIESNEYVFLANPPNAPVIRMATLDWPPYIGESICGQGWVQQVVAGILVAQGFTVHTSFLPWKRAVSQTEFGRTDILFPEYFIPKTALSDVAHGKKRRDLLSLSDPFPGGPVVFWRRKDSKVAFDGNLKTLQKVRIGVVSGYENTPEFDELMDSGYLNVKPAKDDWTNLKKLFYNRVDLIVGDPEVFQFTVYSQLQPQDAKIYLEALETVSPALAENALYLAFSKASPHETKLREAFNAGLREYLQSNRLQKLRQRYSHTAHLGADCSFKGTVQN